MKKFILSILVFLTIFISFAPYSTAKAQTWYNSNPFEWYLKVYDEDASPPTDIFGERYTAAQVQWVLYSVFSITFNLPYTLLGVPPDPGVCLSKVFLGIVDPMDCAKGFKTFIENVTQKYFAYDYLNNSNPLASKPNPKTIFRQIFQEDRPISGISYIRNIGRKLKLVPEAKAAETFGYSRLDVIKDLWAVSRNLAYFLFTLILIIVSFMIMFKVKISPQAVISIQSALPKIFFTLILITFSFAIAGFLIDLMYVVMGIFSLFFVIPPSTLTAPEIYEWISGGASGGGGLYLIGAFCVFFILYIIAIITALFAALLGSNLAGALWAIILGLFSIILIIIAVIYFFTIILALFKALAGFYLAVILGPLQLSLGALPQSKSTLGSWVKTLVGKLAVFPAAGILFYLADVFLVRSIYISLNSLINSFGGDWNDVVNALNPIFSKFGFSFHTIGIDASNLWGPPMLGSAASASSIAFILMAISAIMLIPKVGKAIESALAGTPFDYDRAISEPIKSTAGTAGYFLESKYKDATGKPAAWARSIGRAVQAIAK